jgi:HK97 family phage prohead protease
MNRKFRVIHGISYPNLHQGDQPVKLSSDATNREDFYNDPAVRLANGDCEYFKKKAICLEHDEEDIVGIITDAWKDSDNHMRMTARIFVDSPRGENIYHRVQAGKLKGLSVGYSIPVNSKNERIGKRCKEISLCEVPFFNGAEVRIAATGATGIGGNQQNNSINNFPVIEKNFIFEIMADQKPVEQNDASTATKKDGEEMVKQYDQMLQKMEEMAKKLEEKERSEKEKENQLKMFQEAEQQRRAKYAESQKPVLQEYLDTIKEQIGSEVPEEYKNSMEKAFATPEAAAQTQVVVASAQAYKKQREQNQLLESSLKELMDKVKKLEDDQPLMAAHVQATNRRLGLVTEQHKEQSVVKEIDVGASGGGKPKMYDLFQPSDEERTLYEMSTGKTPDLNVMASSNNNKSEIPEAPKHPFVNTFSSSMRHFKGGAKLYDFLCSRDFDAIPNSIKINDVKRSDD